MTIRDSKDLLRITLNRFRAAGLAEIILVASGLGLLAFSLTRLLILLIPIAVGAGVLAFLVTVIARVRRTGIFRWNDLHIALFLNRTFPELKDSADLLAIDQPLTGLQEVQRQQVLSTLDEVKSHVRIPHRIGQGLLTLAVGVVAYLFLPARPLSFSKIMRTAEVAPAKTASAVPELVAISVNITPPAYTRVKVHTSGVPGFSAPMNSLVKWNISFQGNAINSSIIFSAQDTVALAGKDAKALTAQRKLVQSTFYQVHWSDLEGRSYLSDYYRIDIKPDLAPVVEIADRQQFQEIGLGDPLRMQVLARISDDYGVADAHLVATVSKGSGESVKFREEKLLFENASGLHGKLVELRREIDLQKLGLEPGDELYFYAEAIDNMKPRPNSSRTETFFIALQDTAVAVAVADSGLGVDLMPEYFRSQRQIIIDTEKLLAEQRRIRKIAFNSRSNELGYDQKTLRLRYGQFLGMEDEAGIGVEAALPVREAVGQAVAEVEEDPLKRFGHQHDTKNEQNLVDEKKGVKVELGHDHEKTKEEEEEDPMKAFVHQHDSQEEATFFIQSVKTKLKAALTLMWDSELHLRMYEPKKSLPFQYRILALLKEIAQDSRVYVHRTGFDPPPIKEEKRLTGELDEVMNSMERTNAEVTIEYAAIQAALIHVEHLLQQTSFVVSDSTRILANRAGYEVAVEELAQPGRYLQTLSDLRKLADGKVESDKLQLTLLNIRQAFWSILPAETYSPTRGKRTLHPLDQAVLNHLDHDLHD